MGQFLTFSKKKHHLLSSESQFSVISPQIDSFDAFFQTFLGSSQQTSCQIVHMNAFPGKDVIFFENLQEFGLMSRFSLTKSRNFATFARFLQLLRGKPMKFPAFAEFQGLEELHFRGDCGKTQLGAKFQGFFVETLENLLRNREKAGKFYTEMEIVAIFAPFFETLHGFVNEKSRELASFLEIREIFLTSDGYRAVFKEFAGKTRGFREILVELAEMCLQLLGNCAVPTRFAALLRDLLGKRVTFGVFLNEMRGFPRKLPDEAGFFSLKRCESANLLHEYAFCFEKSRNCLGAEFLSAHRRTFSAFPVRQEAFFLDKLASFLAKDGLFADACAIYAEILEIFQRFDAETRDFCFEKAVVCSNYGSLLIKAGEISRGVALLQRTREFCEENKGISLKTVKMINNLAEMYRQTGDFHQALALHLRALRYKCEFPCENETLLVSLNNLAMIYAENEGKSQFLRTIVGKMRSCNENSKEKPVFLYNLAWICWKIGEIAEARGNIEKLEELDERIPEEIQEKAIKLREMLDFSDKFRI